MAKMIVPTPTNRIDDRGIDASDTASMLRAKSIHSSRPMTMLRGIPKRAPKTAATVACQAIAEASCRCVKPSAFKSAKSRQRRRTDAPSVMPSAAIAPNANRQEAGQMATETRPMTKKGDSEGWFITPMTFMNHCAYECSRQPPGNDTAMKEGKLPDHASCYHPLALARTLAEERDPKGVGLSRTCNYFSEVASMPRMSPSSSTRTSKSKKP